jgi:DNA-binding HxlR family transcriptional regulator
MTSQDVLSEIRALKSDLSVFSDQMVRLRYDDLKAAFLEQMRMAVGEEGRKSFHDDVSTLNDSSGCERKADCLRGLGMAVDRAAGSFMRDDLPGANRVLDEVEALIRGDCSPCQDGDCSRTAVETLRRVRAILQVYEGLVERFGPNLVVRPGAGGEARSLTAEDMESILDPLANAWRIKVLAALRRGDHSLTELGRAVDLKTGHLQFHLRALVGAGFVLLDRQKHRYSLTERGALALSCTEEMASKLGPLAPSPVGNTVPTGTRRATDVR